MLAAPPLLVLLLFSLVSAFSTLTLLLLPLVTRFSPWKLLNPSRPLPRSFYPSLSPRPAPQPQAGAERARRIAVCLAAVDLGGLSLGLWQGLLLSSRASSTAAGSSGTDRIGEGVRMGLALVGRQVAWCAVLAYLVLDARATRPTSSPSAVARRGRTTALYSLGAAAAVIVLLGALFAGVAAVDLVVVYGVALAAGLVLMVCATAAAGSMLFAAAKSVEVPDERRAQAGREKSSDTRRGEGWCEGESWISSPDQSMRTLPPFDLSLTPKSQHAHLLRADTPAGAADASRPNSWLSSPSRSGSPVPQWSFSDGSHNLSYPSASVDKTPTSWLSEPSSTQPTLSPFSYPSTSGDGGRTNSRSPTPDLEGSSWSVVVPSLPVAPGPASPLATGGADPFAATPRGVSAYTTASGYSTTTLSPPPRIPLPPTPPPSDEACPPSAARSSTSSRWTTTTGTDGAQMAATANEWTAPSSAGWTPSSFSNFGDVHYQAARAPGTATTATFGSAGALGLIGTGDDGADREKAFSTVDLGGSKGAQDAGRALTRTVRMARKDVGLYGAMIGCAWLVFALLLPTFIDSLTRPNTPADSVTTITLVLSITLSSPATLLFALLLRTRAFRSALAPSPSSANLLDCSASSNDDHASSRPSSTLYGSVQPAIIVQSSTPLKPSAAASAARRASQLRPLKLVDALADNRSSASLSSAASGKGFMQGRCLTPNEEGNLADVWHKNGHVSRPASRLSRVMSMLVPSPTLQQMPVHSPSELAYPPAAGRPSSRATSRAPSPTPSVASSHATEVSVLADEADRTAAPGADGMLERAYSMFGSVHKATVSTAQRGTRVSGDMARIVYMPPPSPVGMTTKFGAVPVLDAEARMETKISAYSIDWMTAGLLPRLVPTIRIGRDVEVTRENRPASQSARNTATGSISTAAGTVARSIIRRLSSYDKEELPFQNPAAETSQPSSVRSRSGAQAPTLSHGRSSSIEMRSTSFLSKFFDSPSVVASTPSRPGAQTIRHRARPSGDYRPKHKAYNSLPTINALEIDEMWSAEVLDEFGKLAADDNTITLGELELSLGDSFAAPGGKRTFGEPAGSDELDAVDEGDEDDARSSIGTSSRDVSGRSTPAVDDGRRGSEVDEGMSDPDTTVTRLQKSTLGPPSSSESPSDDTEADATTSDPSAGTARRYLDDMLLPEDPRPLSQVSSAFSDSMDLEHKLAQLQAELAGASTVEDLDFQMAEDERASGAEDGASSDDGDGNESIVPDLVHVEGPTPARPESVSRQSQIPDMETGTPHSEYRMPLRLHRSASEASALTVASTCSEFSEAFSYHSPTPLPRAGLTNVGRIKAKPKPAKVELSAPPRASSSLSVYRPGSSASHYSGAVRPETAQSFNSRPGSRQDVLAQSRQMNAVVEERPEDLKGSQSSSKKQGTWSPVRKVGAVFSRAEKSSATSASARPIR